MPYCNEFQAKPVMYSILCTYQSVIIVHLLVYFSINSYYKHYLSTL